MKSVNKEVVNKVKVNQICGHCDITKPTFYKYVDSKNDLILNLYDQTILNILGDTLTGKVVRPQILLNWSVDTYDINHIIIYYSILKRLLTFSLSTV